jgi:hypothetical protein
MTSEDPQMSKQGAADKRKLVTLVIPLKLEIIMRLGSGKSCSVVVASCNFGRQLSVV